MSRGLHDHRGIRQHRRPEGARAGEKRRRGRRPRGRASASTTSASTPTSRCASTSNSVSEGHDGLDPDLGPAGRAVHRARAGGDEQNLADGDRIKITQSAVVLEKLIGQFLYGKAAESREHCQMTQELAIKIRNGCSCKNRTASKTILRCAFSLSLASRPSRRAIAEDSRRTRWRAASPTKCSPSSAPTRTCSAGNRQKSRSSIEAKVLPHFDFARMTRLAVGRNWRAGHARAAAKR